MPSSREIRRRIKSTQNIAKITKAMELVAAAKMRKAQAAAIASRPYAQLSGELIRRLATKADLLEYPLIKRVVTPPSSPPKIGGDRGGMIPRTLLILITSDKGLAGALNSNVINKALNVIKSEGAEKIDLITIGKKGSDSARRMKLNVIAAFDGKDKNISILDARPIAEIAIADYLALKYEKVFAVYTDFVSTLVQKPNMIQLLPFADDGSQITDHGLEYLFEPSPIEVLERLIGSTVEFAIYQCLVEAVASEHSARMVAMKNANDAAGDLIDDLTLSYNQARQAGITKELSEISAAKLAMEG
ncbi:MAG: ATP synthase F1 subunit gamma [Candidatus Doudnabacteria bacterium]|nr:ATP synthase F1 subunit gamma [Candidatus Doudnabacteria bacterium]